MLAVMSYPPPSEAEQPPFTAAELSHRENVFTELSYSHADQYSYHSAYPSPWDQSLHGHHPGLMNLPGPAHTTPVTHSTPMPTSLWPPYNAPSGAIHSYSFPGLPQSMRPLPSHMESPHASVSGGSSRRSPSTLDLSRPSLGLGLHYNSHDSAISTSTPALFEPELLTSPTPSTTSQSRPKKIYPLLAPSTSSQSPKRSRPEDDDKDSVSSGTDKRRRVTTSSIPNVDLADEDKFLVQLKEEEDLPWKAIAARFTSHYGRTFQVAALQMRYKRLREKHRAWTAEDLEALRSAHEYWEKAKWDIISAKMTEFGVADRWPAKLCARKWQALHDTPVVSQQQQQQQYPSDTMAAPVGMYGSAPIDRTGHYMPIP